MKNHPSKTKAQKYQQQSLHKIKPLPPKNHAKKVKPNRKFGDDLTNLWIQPFQTNKKDMSTPKAQKDNLQIYHSEIQNHLLQEDLTFYSYLTSTMETAPNIKITSDMRKILIKWLIEVAHRFCCVEETLHLTIQLIDILLIQKGLLFDKTNFQLLGITALFIAFKYNEIQVPESAKFLYVCDGLYQLADLLHMEALILLTVNFNLQLPTIYNFLSFELKNQNADKKSKKFIEEFASWCLLDFNLMNNFKKSEIAALLVCFGIKVIHNKSNQIWNEEGLEKRVVEMGVSVIGKVYKMYKKQKDTYQ